MHIRPSGTASVLKPCSLLTCVGKEEDLQQDLIVVLDTNILLSHLDFVKKMRSHGLGGMWKGHCLKND